MATKKQPGKSKSTTTHAAIVAKIGASEDTLTLPRTRKQDLQFLQDFPVEFFDLPCIEPRCKLCKSVTPIRELRRYLSKSLLSGVHHQEILDVLLEHGIEATAANLSTHYRRHVLPYVMDAIRAHATTSVFVKAAQDLGHDTSLAEVMVSSLLLKLQPIVEALDPAQLMQLDAGKQIGLLLKSTTALSQIQNLEATAKLRALDLMLKRARLSEAEREALQRAYGELRGVLQAHPDLWREVETILLPLVDTPALPAATGGAGE